MTSLAVSQVVVDGLMTGQLAIGVPEILRGLPVHVECSPPIKHLFPVSVLPVCDTCKGSGKITQPFESGDFMATYWETFSFLCHACNGSGLPSQLTLTVECGHEAGYGLTGAEWEGQKERYACDFCNDSNQVPVCRVTIEKALPIIGPRMRCPADTPHVCWHEPSWPGPTLVIFDADSSPTTDVSHLLLPGLVWVGYALIVTAVETL